MNQNVDDFVEFLRVEFKRRILALEQIVANRIAEQVLEDVQKKIPSKPALLGQYKAAFKIYRVDVAEGRVVTIAAQVPASLLSVEAGKTLVFFPLPKKGKPTRVISILAKHEPWAVSMVPGVTIKTGTQEVVFKHVSASEVYSATVANQTVLPAVLAELKTVGARLGEEFVVDGIGKVDLTDLATRVEFGGVGVPHVPHWRASLSRAQKGGVLKQGAFQRFVFDLLTNPSFSRWKADAAPPGRTMDKATAGGFVDFQNRII